MQRSLRGFKRLTNCFTLASFAEMLTHKICGGKVVSVGAKLVQGFFYTEFTLSEFCDLYRAGTKSGIGYCFCNDLG